jgi:hypothetical protein
VTTARNQVGMATAWQGQSQPVHTWCSPVAQHLDTAMITMVTCWECLVNVIPHGHRGKAYDMV